MQLETANYLIRGVSPFLLWMTTSISVGSAHTLFVMSPAAFQQQKWAREGITEGKNKNSQDTNTQVALLLAWGPRDGPEEDGEKEGRGSSVASPGAVSRSHTRSARQQTQFTKRHLFHYSNALWLITSWPVCEMTATYSLVNRKICTCSMWGVGAQRSGGWGGRKGGQPRGKRKDRRKPKKERFPARQSRSYWKGYDEQ